jgi:RNA polymerase sigma-70 factor (ECF subfamily)
VVATLMPDEPEVLGLLALMLLQDSRRRARADASGDLILLQDQDRSLWDREAIDEGVALLARSARMGRPGLYRLQAAIASEHATADSAEETDWARIVTLYDRLLDIHPAPVARLNRAVAVAKSMGPKAGLAALEEVQGELSGYHSFHIARSEMLRQTGDPRAANLELELALSLTTNDAERRYLEGKLQ